MILTTFEQDDYIFGALNAGASGFLLKRTSPEELIAGIHTVAVGDSLFTVTRRVIDRMASSRRRTAVRRAAGELTRATGRSGAGRARRSTRHRRALSSGVNRHARQASS